jgi:hypothetical protein
MEAPRPADYSDGDDEGETEYYEDDEYEGSEEDGEADNAEEVEK